MHAWKIVRGWGGWVGVVVGLVAVAGLAVSGAAAEEEAGLRPYPANPFYWEYRGEPVVMLGASDTDSLFQWTGDRLEDHLDLLVSVGGNYVRNVMATWEDPVPPSDGPVVPLYPYERDDDGRFDLDRFNEAYFDRLDNLLRQTHERGIFVQIELWEAFMLGHSHWQRHPYHPANNINYAMEDSGLPAEWPHTPHRRNHPVILSVPPLPHEAGRDTVLPYMQRFAERVYETTLPYDHVMFTVLNEASAPQAFSDYWAEFLHELAAEHGRTVWVSDMRAADRPGRSAEPQAHQIAHPELYNFLDASKNSRDLKGDAHWRGLLDIRERLGDEPRPINHTKLVNRHYPLEVVANRWLRNIFAGAASNRFHRPTSPPPSNGIGLTEPAQKLIRAGRDITDGFEIFACHPANGLLIDREADVAYCTAEPGRQYAVLFIEPAAVELDISDADGPLRLRWYDIANTRWLNESRTVSPAASVTLTPPREAGRWAAVLVGEE